MHCHAGTSADDFSEWYKAAEFRSSLLWLPVIVVTAFGLVGCRKYFSAAAYTHKDSQEIHQFLGCEHLMMRA